MVSTHRDAHKCLQSREIKHCTYKFLSEKIFDQVRVNPEIPVKAVQDQLQRDLGVQISMSKAFRAKAKLRFTNPNTTVKIAVERNTDPSLPTRVFQRIYVCLGALKLGFRACRRNLLGLDGVFMKGPFPGQVLAVVGLESNNGIYSLAYALVKAEKHKYCLRHIHKNMKHEWCGQAYKDLLWRSASATSVKDFEKCMLELKKMNPKAHEWAKSDLLLNNICEVFNDKIVGGRDKLVITLLEYIWEYCIKRIVNVQSVIDKCTGPLTPTAARIIESIKKEAHFKKVQWNGANKKRELTGIPCKHDVAACWNMALNDRAAPPLEVWVNPCYWLTTWRETYSHKVGRPWKKIKRSKRKDEPFVKYGQGRNATTGGNNAGASGSASRQAQQTEPAVGQDGSGGSGVGAVIGLLLGWTIGGLGGGGYLRDYVRVVGGTDDGASEICLSDSDNKGTDVMKDKVSQKNVCEEYVPLNNNIGKQIGDFVDMHSKALEQGMDANVPDEIDGAKGEQVPNNVVKKGNLEFLVCKEVANHGVNKPVDKGRPLKRKMVYAE
ncbi:hypothetical protein Tco_0697849 [Tanacetum coccineum]